ncbi:MAG: hypothetical protein AAGI10_05000 [Pseudomonadota bacterium]
MTPSELHEELLAAHVAGDGQKMVELYTTAANQTDDTDEEMFFLTHAFIFALEAGHPTADELRARLKAQGRID